MTRRPLFGRRAQIAGALGVVALVWLALPALEAGATLGSASITGATLAFVSTPSTVSFSDTLNGLNQTTTAGQSIDVGDATGSGSGWNITATSTTFCTAGNAHCMATSATTIQTAPSVACDSNSTCTTAHDTVTYPYTLPAAASAPTATKMFNADVLSGAGTGLGDQTVSATFQLAVPANTYAGSYSSIWTYSLVVGP